METLLLQGVLRSTRRDHTSYPDVFLIKTDAEGIPIFEHIYYPWVGDDRSESGSSIVLQQDGGFGIGVPTMSFTNWSQGFVPNKNAVYSTDANGLIQKVVFV